MIISFILKGTAAQSVATEAGTDLTVTPADNQAEMQDMTDVTESRPEEGVTAAVANKTQEVWMDFENFCKCFK